MATNDAVRLAPSEGRFRGLRPAGVSCRHQRHLIGRFPAVAPPMLSDVSGLGPEGSQVRAGLPVVGRARSSADPFSRHLRSLVSLTKSGHRRQSRDRYNGAGEPRIKGRRAASLVADRLGGGDKIDGALSGGHRGDLAGDGAVMGRREISSATGRRDGRPSGSCRRTGHGRSSRAGSQRQTP